MKVRVRRVDKTLPLPEYHTDGAVAFDLYSRTEATIDPKTCERLPTNLIIEVPEGYAFIIAARSGLYKKGLVMRNGIGIIDQDYHGPEDEISMVMYNFSEEPVAVSPGDRLAQGIFIPTPRVTWEEEDTNLKENSRGGFGSTGN